MALISEKTWLITANGDSEVVAFNGGRDVQFVATGTFDGATLSLQSKLGEQNWIEVGTLTADGKLDGAIRFSGGEKFKVVTSGGGTIDVIAMLNPIGGC